MLVIGKDKDALRKQFTELPEAVRLEVTEAAKATAAEAKRILGEMTALRSGELDGLNERVHQLYHLFGKPKPKANGRLTPDVIVTELKGMRP